MEGGNRVGKGWGQESGLCAGVGRCGRSGRALAGALSSGFLNTLTSPAQSWLSLALAGFCVPNFVFLSLKV